MDNRSNEENYEGEAGGRKEVEPEGDEEGQMEPDDEGELPTEPNIVSDNLADDDEMNRSGGTEIEWEGSADTSILILILLIPN